MDFFGGHHAGRWDVGALGELKQLGETRHLYGRFICLYPLYYLIHIQNNILHHLHLCWRSTVYGDKVLQTQITFVDKHMAFELVWLKLNIFSNIHIYYSPQRLAIMLCHVNTIGMSVRREMQWSVAVDTFVYKWMLEFLLSLVSLVDDKARSTVCGLMLILENLQPTLTLSWQYKWLVLHTHTQCPNVESIHLSHNRSKGTTLSIHIQIFSCVPLPTWPPTWIWVTFVPSRYPLSKVSGINIAPAQEDAEHLTLERHLLPFGKEWPEPPSTTLRPLETATGGDPENALETLSLVTNDVEWCEVMEKSYEDGGALCSVRSAFLVWGFRFWKWLQPLCLNTPTEKTGAVKHNILSYSSCGIAYRYSITPLP